MKFEPVILFEIIGGEVTLGSIFSVSFKICCNWWCFNIADIEFSGLLAEIYIRWGNFYVSSSGDYYDKDFYLSDTDTGFPSKDLW